MIIFRRLITSNLVGMALLFGICILINSATRSLGIPDWQMLMGFTVIWMAVGLTYTARTVLYHNQRNTLGCKPEMWNQWKLGAPWEWFKKKVSP